MLLNLLLKLTILTIILAYIRCESKANTAGGKTRNNKYNNYIQIINSNQQLSLNNSRKTQPKISFSKNFLTNLTKPTKPTTISPPVEITLSDDYIDENAYAAQFFDSNFSFKDDAQDTSIDYLFTLYNDIKFWREVFIIVGAIITVFGVTLNTLCIIIFYKSKLFQNSSFPYYVYVLSIIDTLNLIIRYVVPQLTETIVSQILLRKYNATSSTDYEIYTEDIVSDSHCNVLMYVHNSLGFMSTWIMAAVSIERWLVIKYPMQSKRIINIRALVILISIFITVLLLNLFDLAPDFYSKPQWFSNLTLLCEPQDSAKFIHVGFVEFNADVLSFARTLLQAVGPFLVALFFNSLIIHNFKRIKSAAYRIKSNSTASVMSHSSVCSKQVSQVAHSQTTQLNENKQQTSLLVSSHAYGTTLQPPNANQMNLQDTSAPSMNALSTSNTNLSSPTHHKHSFRRKLSKLKLNRETDIMLIVLSFAILITQLPCTVTWYLIYYRLILTYIDDVYLAARSPILLYILRLVEMLYFSMNFIFYIALSPSLRKEMKLNPSKALSNLLTKKLFKCQDKKKKSTNLINESVVASSGPKVLNFEAKSSKENEHKFGPKESPKIEHKERNWSLLSWNSRSASKRSSTTTTTTVNTDKLRKNSSQSSFASSRRLFLHKIHRKNESAKGCKANIKIVIDDPDDVVDVGANMYEIGDVVHSYDEMDNVNNTSNLNEYGDDGDKVANEAIAEESIPNSPTTFFNNCHIEYIDNTDESNALNPCSSI